jgi:predicted ATPase
MMNNQLRYEPREYRLDAIRLENFMGFEDTGWIELRPITFLFGRNSAGKSAIIRALLLLKQSVEAHNSENPLAFSGDLIDLRTYHNIVFGHETKRDVAFTFRIGLTEGKTLSQSTNDASDEQLREQNAEVAGLNTKIANWPKKVAIDDVPLEIRLSFGLLEEDGQPRLKSVDIFGYRSNNQVQVFGVKYDLEDRYWKNPKSNAPLDYEVLIPLVNDGNPEMDKSGREMRVPEHRQQFSDPLWQTATLELVKNILPILRADKEADIRKEDIPEDWRIVSDALNFFNDTIRRFLTSINYLPPLRDQAQRSYRIGEPWINLFSWHPDAPRKISEWLKAMDLDATVESQPFSTTEGLVGVYLQEKALKTNLRDTGAGLAQAIPVIATLLKAQQGDLVIIEQPEIHLHPEAHQTLAALLCECVGCGVRVLIETHSEHLFYHTRRLLSIPTKEKSSPESKDFLMIFVKRSERKSEICLVRLNSDGVLDKPPAEIRYFFGYNEEARKRLDDDLRMRLKRGLISCFEVDDLKSMCFELDYDSENYLIGNSKDSKIENLILCCERRGDIHKLFRRCMELRPRYDW